MDAEEFGLIVAGITRLSLSSKQGYDVTFAPEESKALLEYIERLQDFKIKHRDIIDECFEGKHDR